MLFFILIAEDTAFYSGFAYTFQYILPLSFLFINIDMSAWKALIFLLIRNQSIDLEHEHLLYIQIGAKAQVG